MSKVDELFAAVNRKNLQAVADILDQQVDPNSQGDDNKTALHEAAWNGDVAMISFLIDRGAKLNQRDSYGRTALHDAANNCKVEAIKALLEKGALPNLQDKIGNTPLRLVADFEDKSFVDSILVATDALLNAGADANQANDDGVIPLFTAAMCANLRLVERLLKENATSQHIDKALKAVNEEAKNDDRYTPIVQCLMLAKLDAKLTSAKQVEEHIELMDLNGRNIINSFGAKQNPGNNQGVDMNIQEQQTYKFCQIL